MNNRRDSKAYVILEVNSDQAEKAARIRVRKIRQFLFHKRDYPRDRFVFLLSRTNSDFTMLWIWPNDSRFTLPCENCREL